MDGSQDGVGYQMVSTQRERPTAVAHNLLVLFRDILACHRRVVQVGSNIANIGHLRMRSCSSHMCSDSLTWSRENGISPVTLFMGLRRTDSVLIWRGPNLVPGLQRNSCSNVPYFVVPSCGLQPYPPVRCGCVKRNAHKADIQPLCCLLYWQSHEGGDTCWSGEIILMDSVVEGGHLHLPDCCQSVVPPGNWSHTDSGQRCHSRHFISLKLSTSIS